MMRTKIGYNEIRQGNLKYLDFRIPKHVCILYTALCRKECAPQLFIPYSSRFRHLMLMTEKLRKNISKDDRLRYVATAVDGSNQYLGQ